MARLSVFISDETGEYKKILAYLRDINRSEISVLYSTKTRLSDSTKYILSNNRTTINVSSNPSRMDECCLEWNKSSHSITHPSQDISHAVGKMCDLQHNCYIVGNDDTKRIFFFDAPHKSNLPTAFTHIQQIACLDELKIEIKKCGIEPFSLNDKSLFTHQREDYYKCNDTGCYWYIDRLHRNHYEVFDPSGNKHLGEASMQGILDTSKADKSKKPLKV